MRAGYYLCFFGMHVLTPTVMEHSGRMGSRRPAFSAALAELARHEQYLALEEPTAATISARATACSPRSWRWR